MSKEEFLNYLPEIEQAVARHTLPIGTHSIEEWREIWKRILNSAT